MNQSDAADTTARERKKMKKWKKVLLLVAGIPLALFIALMAWGAHEYNKMTPEEKAAIEESRSVAQSEQESRAAAEALARANSDTKTEADAKKTTVETEATQAAASTATTIANSTATSYRVATKEGSDLRVRSGPSTDTEQIGGIPNGSIVAVSEIKNGWGHVVYGDINGWCSMEFLVDPTAATSSKATTTKAPATKSSITYEDLARNPLDYFGETVTLYGKVGYTGTTSSGMPYFILYVSGDYKKSVYVEYFGINNRVLLDDWVTFTGVSMGLDEGRSYPWVREIVGGTNTFG